MNSVIAKLGYSDKEGQGIKYDITVAQDIANVVDNWTKNTNSTNNPM